MEPVTLESDERLANCRGKTFKKIPFAGGVVGFHPLEVGEGRGEGGGGSFEEVESVAGTGGVFAFAKLETATTGIGQRPALENI